MTRFQKEKILNRLQKYTECKSKEIGYSKGLKRLVLHDFYDRLVK